MTTKQNDILLNILANPTFTLADFQTVGLTAENTSLHSIEEYKNSTKITENPLLQTDGQFDENKLLKFYEYAASQYNLLSTQDYNTSVLNEVQYSKDNIWVEPEKRTLDFTPKLVRQPNEFLISNSLESIGKKGQRQLSDREIAQTRPVYNVETGFWEDSPNDSFFDNLTKTLVLATYDEDEYDSYGNLIHQKGEKKLDSEGLPYYETLGGRSVYGKQVLNKFNVITTDGSFANKFDFFDSDDLEQKGTIPTLLKNATLVGSMFIPYVGPWITGANVAVQLAGMATTLAKMAGSDSPFVNDLEGWVKSVNRTDNTDYAIENTWSMENFLNMIGDTAGQLAEQRWIFTTLPALFGGAKATKAMRSKKGYEEVLKRTEKDLLKKNTAQRLINEEGQNIGELIALNSELKNLAKTKAVSAVDDLIKKYSKVGGNVAIGYMVGLTTLDTYSEALQAGASKEEAMWLTLGYAGAEALLLKSGVGEWIMPELKGTRIKNKAINQALIKEVKEAYGSATTKKGLATKLFNIGKDLHKTVWGKISLQGKNTAQIVGMHALAESFEETSEELLADLSKTIFNGVRWLQGEKSLDLGEWSNMIDRYGMSALGGFFGGGVASVGTSFHQSKHLVAMDRATALHELIYLVNTGQDKKFLKELDRMTLGDKNLSATKIVGYDTDNNPIYDEGTNDDNQDLALKNLVKQDIEMIRSILKSEGALISPESMLSRLTTIESEELLNNIKYNALQKSQSINAYMQDFAMIQKDIVVKTSELLSLQPTDGGTISEDIENREKALKSELKVLRDKRDAYLNGSMSKEVIRNAVYEMNPYLHMKFSNVKLFAKAKYGKSWEDMSKLKQDEATTEYREYLTSSAKTNITTQAKIYWDMLTLFSPVIKKLLEDSTYNGHIVKGSHGYGDLKEFVAGLLRGINPEETNDTYIQNIQEVNNQASESTIETIAFVKDVSKEGLESAVNKIIANDYIHPEMARTLVDGLEWLAGETQKTITEKLSAGDFTDTTEEENLLSTISSSIEKIQKIKFSTPILDLLKQFQISVTTSQTDLMQHLQSTINVFDANKKDIQNILFDDDWEANNKEALKLLDAFIAVVKGMRKDNSDIFNPTSYTSILNNIYGDNALLELDSEQADLILSDALLVQNRLQQAELIWRINTGRKLKEQETVAIHTTQLILDSTRRFVDCIPEDWEEKRKIKALLDTNVLSTNSEGSLNLEQKNLLDKQMIQLEDTIYEMFQKHGFGQLKNMITKFAAVNGFFQKTGKPLNAETEFLEDNAYIWWLASKAALKSSDFYGAYAKILSDKIAPIQSQLLGVYMGVAAIVNQDVLNIFLKNYRESIIDTYNTLPSIDEKRRVLNNFNGAIDFPTLFDKYFPEFDAVPKYLNMILIEGIAGSGKSFGIIQQIVNTLRSTGVLKDCWYVHATQNSADQAIENMSLEGAKGLDRIGFMKMISSEWKDATLNNNTLYEESFSIEDGTLKNTWKLKKSSSLPKVVFIDEVSRFNSQELTMISQWAVENGVVVITAGDFDQSRQVTYVQLNNVKAEFTIARNQFIRIPKLGLTLRTASRQMTHCVTAMRANVEQDTNNNPLMCLMRNSAHPGIHGIYTDNKLNDETKQAIDLLFNTATEKVGFIYYSTETELYKYIMDNYSDQIEPFKDSDAQGLESQYYIIEANFKDPEYRRTVYTGITRSQQGGILITSNCSSDDNYVSNVKDTLYQEESLTATDVENSSKRKRKQLEEFISDGTIKPTDLQVKAPRIVTPTITVPPLLTSEPTQAELIGNYYESQEAAEKDLPEIGITVVDSDGKEFEIIESKVVKHDEGFVPYVVIESQDTILEITVQQLLSEYTVKEDQEKFDQLYQGTIVLQDNSVVEIVNFDKNTGNYTLSDGRTIDQHELQRLYKQQFIPQQVINEIDPDPQLITEANSTEETPSVNEHAEIPRLIHKLYTNTAFWDDFDASQINSGRIDGIYGIINLLGKSNINKLRGQLATCRRLVQEGEIPELLKFLNLHNKKNEIRYAIKSTSPNSRIPRYMRAAKMFFLDLLGLNPEPTDKNLVLFIKSDGIPTIEIPIASLNNPITLMLDGSYDVKFWNTFENATGTDYDKLNEVILTYDGQVPKHEQDLINLCKFYLFSSDGIFYLQKDGKPIETPLKFQQTGPKIIKKAGDKQWHEELNQYTATFTELSKFANNPSFRISPLLMSKDGYVGNDYRVNPGYPFVLVSDTVEQKHLVTEFEKGNPYVKLFYVIPPRATVEDWLANLHKHFTQVDQSKEYYIGNSLTSYRVLSKARSMFKGISDNLTKSIMQIVDKLDSIEQKWNSSNIEFTGIVLEKGQQDSSLFEEISKERGEAQARRYCMLREQLIYLESNYEGSIPISSDRTNVYALNYYVHRLVYPQKFQLITTDEGRETPGYQEGQLNRSNLNILEEYCKDLIITYVPRYDDATMGSFIKVKVSQSNQYALFDGADFLINAKLDTSTLTLGTLLASNIAAYTHSTNPWNSRTSKSNTHRTAHYFYNSTNKTWELTDLGKVFENHYLGTQTKPAQPKKDPIEQARENNSKYKGRYYFVHEGNLHYVDLTSGIEFPNSVEVDFDTNGTIQVTDTNNVTYTLVVTNGQLEATFTPKAPLLETTYELPTQDEYLDFKEQLIPVGPVAKYFSYLKTIDSVDEALTQMSSKQNLENALLYYKKHIIKEDSKAMNFVNKMLNYVKNKTNLNSNEQNSTNESDIKCNTLNWTIK